MTQKTPPLSIDDTPITVSTFKSQGWTRIDDKDADNVKYHYWILPLPKDNPDEEAVCFISSAHDEWHELGIPKGHYVAELQDLNGLGYVESEEGVEILYRALTGDDIYDK